MKNKYVLFVMGLFACTLLGGCTEVIDLKLPEKADRIVFNANIVITGNPGVDLYQYFFINYVADLNDSVPPPVSGAQVLVTDDLNNTFVFQEGVANFGLGTPRTGCYICTNFFASGAKNYKMKVIYNGETYEGSEDLLYTPPIDSAVIKQRSDESSMGLTYVTAYTRDIAGEYNAYEMFYDVNNKRVNTSQSWGVFDDRFHDGREIETSIVIEDKYAQPGDTIQISQLSVSETNYRFLVTLQTQSYQASPFSPAPASIRGNVTNSTDVKHYPLGYFRVNNFTTYNLPYPLK